MAEKPKLNLLRKVFEIGVLEQNQEEINRKIKLSNAFAFFNHIGGYMLAYIFYKMSGTITVFYMTHIANLGMLIVLWLNYLGKHLTSRVYLIAYFSLVTIFFQNLLGDYTSIHFFLILVVGFSLILFVEEERKYAQIAILFPFLAFIVLEASLFNYIVQPLSISIETQKYIRWIVVATVFVLFLAMIITFKNDLHKAKEQIQFLLYETIEQNEVLEAQEEEMRQNVEELLATQEILDGKNQLLKRKNDFITSSITYAQTIQKAILPTQEDINQIFNEWFIIYRPKDIVSGDFYWMSYVEKKIFIAVVDCTGHGVPGAFMSMVGSTLLNEIINEKHIIDVNTILEVLHFKVKKALRQQSGHNQDGMDVCLCRLDYQSESAQVQLQYAGAKRPLFYLSNGDLHKLKGDKQSIAGWSKDDRCFMKQAATLQKGDCIYLSSDGFIDTPSPRRKSLGNRRFEQTLKQQGDYSMNKQKGNFLQMLSNHQQHAEQRDDITLFGIKV